MEAAAPRPTPPPWERWALRLLLLAFVLAGLNHIRTQTVYGQDFLLHSTSTEQLLAHPDQWFPQDFTNRPLVYWVGAASHLILPGARVWEMAALIFIALNTLALQLLHATTRRALRSPALRLATVALAAFLPATQVGGIVYAADAVCQLPFALAVWSLLHSLEAPTSRARLGYALLAGLALVLGDFARFTFLALLPATAVVLGLAWRWRRITGRQAAAIGSLALLLPALLAGWIQLRAQRQFAGQAPHHTFNWDGTGELSWSSLLWVKRVDVRLLDAPIYWESQLVAGQPQYVLLVNNRYSYPALLHLSVFTDVLDYANAGQLDDGAIRPEPQQTLARWSVRLGLLISVPALLAVLAFLVRTAAALWRPALAPGTGVLLWGTFALAWYLPIALTLPFVAHAYEWGYWLSRLILPALWGFAVVLFATLDELLPARRWLRGLLAAAVGAQALLHFRCLWY